MKTGCSTAAHGRLAVGQLTGPVTPEAPVEKNGLRPDVTAAKIRLEEAFAPGPRGPVFGRRAASHHDGC